MGIFSRLARLGGRDMAVDLGTANTLVYVRGRGIVLSEPSVVAIDSASGEVQAVGAEAKRMLGRTPGTITAIRPLKDGVIADFDVTEQMLRTSSSGPPVPLRPSARGRLRPLRRHRGREAGGRGGLPVGRRPPGLPDRGADGGGDRRRAAGRRAVATGSMIVDIGGGTTEVAVISLGGIVVSQVDPGRRRRARRSDRHPLQTRTYKLAIGDQTAEEGQARGRDRPRRCRARGRDRDPRPRPRLRAAEDDHARLRRGA